MSDELGATRRAAPSTILFRYTWPSSMRESGPWRSLHVGSSWPKESGVLATTTLAAIIPRVGRPRAFIAAFESDRHEVSVERRSRLR